MAQKVQEYRLIQGDPVQPVTHSGTENTKQFRQIFLFAVKYVDAIPVFITRVNWELLNLKVQEVG